jgi:hypothetical protein
MSASGCDEGDAALVLPSPSLFQGKLRKRNGISAEFPRRAGAADTGASFVLPKAMRPE